MSNKYTDFKYVGIPTNRVRTFFISRYFLLNLNNLRILHQEARD